MLWLTVQVSSGYSGLNRCVWGYWFTWVGRVQEWIQCA
jgi:hypothetical protein